MMQDFPSLWFGFCIGFGVSVFGMSAYRYFVDRKKTCKLAEVREKLLQLRAILCEEYKKPYEEEQKYN